MSWAHMSLFHDIFIFPLLGWTQSGCQHLCDHPVWFQPGAGPTSLPPVKEKTLGEHLQQGREAAVTGLGGWWLLVILKVFSHLNYSMICLAVSYFPVLHAAFITSHLFQSVSSDSSQIPQQAVHVLLPSFPSSKIHLLAALKLLTLFPFTTCCTVMISMAGTLWVQGTASSANCENGNFSSRSLLEHNHSHLPVLKTSQCYSQHTWVAQE